MLTISWFSGRRELLRESVYLPAEVLVSSLSKVETIVFQCLRFVDSEGITVFTQRQMDQFLVEWRLILQHSRTETERDLLQQVERLALSCQQKVHSQIWFEGA